MRTIHKKLLLFFTCFILMAFTCQEKAAAAALKGPAIESMLMALNAQANDPYAASLPVVAAAELGSNKIYQLSLKKMLFFLKTLDVAPKTYTSWMQSEAFKAWMWGRILLAANSIQDPQTTNIAKKKLIQLLVRKEIDRHENMAFYAWAFGYLAALNQEEYYLYKDRMMKHANDLSNIKNQTPLSDMLWCWTLDLYAAANNQDRTTYDLIKQKMMALQNTASVTEALTKGLIRTSKTNDYPAWALAKVQLASALIKDNSLYKEINDSLISSMNSALKSGANAEYLLALADRNLAKKIKITRSLGH